MLFWRRVICSLLLIGICTGPACAQMRFWKHHHKKPQAAPRVAVRLSRSSRMIHTQAQFFYAGQLLAPVDSANAVLYDSTDPSAQDDVAAIASGRNGVQQAEKVCEAFLPGQGGTVGPGGDVYFDFVHRGNYWILVCAQVKFSGVAKPVWVLGTVPISRDEFVSTNAAEYNLPRQLQIVLDPYATELKAKPAELPKLMATQMAALPAPQ